MSHRTLYWLAVVTSTLGAACHSSFCEEYADACASGGGGGEPNGAGGAGGGTGAEGGGGAPQGGNGGGGEGAAGGGPPTSCTPAEGVAIGEECGVFVAAGPDGSGTQDSPYGSVVSALGGLGGKTAIYICGDDRFDASIDLPSGVSLYGQLDCDGWKYAGANPRPTLRGDVNEPAVTVSAGTSTIQSVKLEALEATDAGASSVALWVAGGTVAVVDCDLSAADGAAGAPGDPQAKANTPTAANGGNGTAGCTGAVGVLGGGGQLMCQAIDVAGGLGGSGTNASTGGPGDDGKPLGAMGQGGVGEDAQGVGVPCVTGQVGAFGTAGMPGAGNTTGLGTFTSSAYQGAVGDDGMGPGNFAQGGGGGGGADACTTGLMGSGPSGGGGGAGGCGGNPGDGGQGGGGSFGLVSVNATVSLDNVSIRTGSGGQGGAGDAGQEGMDGGEAGQQGGPSGACPGGPGGKGGRGGAGGGGRGGPSVGIAFVGDAPIETGTIEIEVDDQALGGMGGDGGPGNQGGVGGLGIAVQRQEF